MGFATRDSLLKGTINRSTRSWLGSADYCNTNAAAARLYNAVS